MQARQKNHKEKNQGFTLIELLIVIAIIGLLATLAIVSLTTAQRKARDTKRIADIRQLQNAVELYYSENAGYPDSSVAANDTWAEFGTTIGSYITNMPVDPTNGVQSGVTYVYTYGTNDANNEYFIGAQLEDNAHASLNGDDDVNYVVTTGGAWDALDPVESDDTNPVAATAAYNCSVDRTYCVSE